MLMVWFAHRVCASNSKFQYNWQQDTADRMSSQCNENAGAQTLHRHARPPDQSSLLVGVQQQLCHPTAGNALLGCLLSLVWRSQMERLA